MSRTNDIAYFTLELRYKTFVDDNGNPTAIRLVHEFDNMMFGIEDDPNVPNHGEMVEFIAVQFGLKLSETGPDRPAAIEMRIDGVSKEIIKHLEIAIADTDPIEATMRVYLASDPSKPQNNPPVHLKMSEVTADVHTVTATATMEDFFNRPFPFLKYTVAQYPDLART